MPKPNSLNYPRYKRESWRTKQSPPHRPILPLPPFPSFKTNTKVVEPTWPPITYEDSSRRRSLAEMLVSAYIEEVGVNGSSISSPDEAVMTVRSKFLRQKAGGVRFFGHQRLAGFNIFFGFEKTTRLVISVDVDSR